MASWVTEGTAARTGVRAQAVRHLLVQGDRSDWVLWCSSGKGRVDANPHSANFCRECLALAKEAIADDTLDASDVSGWPVTDGG